jgi:hypothetical protein
MSYESSMTFTPEEGAQIFKRDAMGRVRLPPQNQAVSTRGSSIGILRKLRRIGTFVRIHAVLRENRSSPPPRASGNSSSQKLRSRLGYHFRGNAEGSTLRPSPTAFCRRAWVLNSGVWVSGRRITFGAGEQVLNESAAHKSSFYRQ